MAGGTDLVASQVDYDNFVVCGHSNCYRGSDPVRVHEEPEDEGI